MIEFAIIAAPRCGTTWAANWLTTDTTLCLHDPLWTYHYSDLDKIQSSRKVGVSCTGLLMFPEWLNSHPAKKIILHRDLEEINESLESIGLPKIDQGVIDNLNKIDGIHLHWMDLFNNPQDIYEYLLSLPFDEERFNLLKEMEIQPNFEGLTINKQVTAKLYQEFASIH